MIVSDFQFCLLKIKSKTLNNYVSPFILIINLQHASKKNKNVHAIIHFLWVSNHFRILENEVVDHLATWTGSFSNQLWTISLKIFTLRFSILPSNQLRKSLKAFKSLFSWRYLSLNYTTYHRIIHSFRTIWS